MEAGALLIEPTQGDDAIGDLVVEALRNAGLFADSDRPDLRVITGGGERAPRRGRVDGLAGATVVVVLADPALLGGTRRTDEAVEFRRQGSSWEVTSRGRRFTVRHSVGMAQLMTLLRNPGCDIEATALAGRERHASMTIDPLVDPSARAAYRAHIDELREEIAEAERDGDLGRVDQLRAELRFIAEHLADATGLSGQARNWTSDDERARVAVTKAVRRAIAAVTAEDEALGTALDAAVETGRECRFNAIFEVRVIG
jgi:hypothetical protein